MTQQEAITVLKMGKNVFLTGPAGSGKTYVLNTYIKYLEERGVGVAITASTGIAATHLGGMTIHAWSGIGIKDNLSSRDLDFLEQKPYLWKRFEKASVLIIDEISMLKNSTLDMVDKVCKTFKRNTKPFGGMQVIFSGDFFQLPPVERYSPQAQMEQIPIYLDSSDDIVYEVEDQIKTPFAFTSQSWREADLHVCYLTEQHRQDDITLLSVLNEIRSGEVSDDVREILVNKIVNKEIHEVTKLYTHNIDVDKHNLKELQKLNGEKQVFEMTHKGKASGVEALIRGCLSPEKLVLKVGALVMFVKNNPVAGYVNGTIGEVIGYNTDGFPVVKTKDDREFIATPQSWMIEDQGSIVAEIYQVPLRLAWAVTIHKSQGMTLDSALIDLSQAFVPGQGYVALSRVKTLDGLFLKGINQQALEVHPSVLDFDKKLQELSSIISARLEKTDETRINQCVDEFLISIGGDVKFVPKKKKTPKVKETKKTTYEITRDMILDKKSIDEIFEEREISKNTIIDHIEKLLEQKMIKLSDIEYLKPKKSKDKKDFQKIVRAFEKLETTKLKPVFEYFDEKYDYDLIRLAKVFGSLV